MEDRNIMPRQSGGDVPSSSTRNAYSNKCVLLHKAALKDNWEAAEALLTDDTTLVRAQITRGGETALHIAALQGHGNFVSKLLEKMNIPDMEIQNKKGNTALCFAAAAGHVHIAKKMVEKNRQSRNGELPSIRGCNGVTPIYMAVSQGHSDMAEYLFGLSGFQQWSVDDQISLLTTSIGSELYGLAMKILKQKKELAVAEDSNGDTALEVLARNPLAFCGSNQQGLWASAGSSAEPEICDAYTLFDSLWDCMVRVGEEDAESGHTIHENTPKLSFIAAESGNDGFLFKLICQYPDCLYDTNTSKYTIFHIAVSHRHVKIFNLIYELSGVKDLITTYEDENGNNILHLAATLTRQAQNQLSKIPGPALQMQREVLWYKEVEKIVKPLYRNKKNSEGQTPYNLFLEEHENLRKEGEKFMKQTAKSCMLVTLLIITLVFSSAFTVPGGYNNNTGHPILENNRLFVFFTKSQAVATLSSLTSMVMFLSILTSRYKETDFLNSLPFWLVIGVGALLISIVAMMVEFCSCLLFFEHGVVAITVLLVPFACVTVIFVILNYTLLRAILGCTCGGRRLFRSENHLFS